MENAFHITAAYMEEILAQSPVQGKRELEPLKTLTKAQGIPMKILEDSAVTDNEVEVHKTAGDLWYALQGEATFVHGGTLVDPWVKKNKDGTENIDELRGKRIEEGTITVLRPGDWLWIPPGVPHTHSAAGTARLVIIKVPVVG